MKYLITPLFIIFLVFTINAQNPKWFSEISKIVPFQSTEQDIIRMFGKPKEQVLNSVKYETKDGFLEIEYGTGTCVPLISFYQASKETVVEVHFQLKKKMSLNKLKIDLSKFNREEGDDTQNVIYKSLESGISFSTYNEYYGNDKTKEFLQTFSIYPSDKYDTFTCIK